MSKTFTLSHQFQPGPEYTIAVFSIILRPCIVLSSITKRLLFLRHLRVLFFSSYSSVPFNNCFLVECLNLSFILPIHRKGVHSVHLGIRLRQDLDLRLPTFFLLIIEFLSIIVVY